MMLAYLGAYVNYAYSLVPRHPPPSPSRRGLVHTVCACVKYSVLFSVKSFVQFLVRMWKIILTKLEEPCWNTTFQTWQYHFSKCSVQQKDNKSIYHKGPLVPTEYLSPFVHAFQRLHLELLESDWLLMQCTHFNSLGKCNTWSCIMHDHIGCIEQNKLLTQHLWHSSILCSPLFYLVKFMLHVQTHPPSYWCNIFGVNILRKAQMPIGVSNLMFGAKMSDILSKCSKASSVCRRLVFILLGPP